jgi:hypothetical protein
MRAILIAALAAIVIVAVVILGGLATYDKG